MAATPPILPRGVLPLALLCAAILLPAAAPLPAFRCAAVTLISRSAGLETPSKEEGHTEFEFGDVDGDGELDLVSVGDHGSPHVNSDQHGIMVWLGDGDGAWTVRQFGEFGYGGCALGDLDRDGRQDIAWGIHHNWSGGLGANLMGAALGDGTGAQWSDYGAGLAANGETWGMFATALADFDGDGLLDVVSQSFGGSNGIRAYRNQGDGSWSQGYALTGGSVGYTIESADVNADGYLDIVSTRAGSPILLGDGRWGFSAAGAGLPATGIHGIAVGDIHGDGRVDISFGYSSSGVRCYAYDGLQWIDQSAGLPVSGYYDLTQFGDIDGDGRLDLVVYQAPIGQVYLGDGAGHWTADATWQMPSPGEASALRVDGDCDHDGRDDIAVSASMSGFPFYRNQLRVYSPWSEPTELSARVVSPRGGETLRQGSARILRWRAAVPPAHGAAVVDLALSTTGNGGPWTTIASGVPNCGSYQWTVAAAAPGAEARLRVTVTTALGSVSAMSEADFTIAGDFAGVDARLDLALDPGAGAADRARIFPSPARDRVTVLARRPAHLPAILTLHDLSGRRIGGARVLAAGIDSDALSLSDLAGSDLPAGRYYLRVRSGAWSRALPLVRMPGE